MSDPMSDARPSALEDENAIRRLVSFYSDAVSHLDAARAASVYVEDGCVSIAGSETVGRAAIAAGMRQSFAHFRMLQLIAHGGLVAVDGDRAAARWSTVELGVRHGADGLACILGRYEDELVRTAAGWRFARRRFTLAGRTLVDSAKLQTNPDFAASLALVPALASLSGGLDAA